MKTRTTIYLDGAALAAFRLRMPGQSLSAWISKRLWDECEIGSIGRIEDEIKELEQKLKSLHNAKKELIHKQDLPTEANFRKWIYTLAAEHGAYGAYRFKSFSDFVSGMGLRFQDRKSTRLNSSHIPLSRMPSSA